MNPDQFIGLLQHPEKLDAESAQLLENLIREFPYCQPAHLLYLWNLYIEGDLRFNQQLKVTAMYAPDRRRLYEMIRLSHIPRIQTSPTDDTKGPEMVKQVESALPLIEPDLVSFEYREESPEPVPAPPPRKPVADLIDQFIKNSETRIIRADLESSSKEDLSIDSLKEDDEMLTETLAKIYIQQGYYLKALQSYEKLSLKFPEKSIYFATQIDMIRELIKNQ
ncbi:MAG: hypothetical protein V2A67_05400 [Bacteroidota bacterium]